MTDLVSWVFAGIVGALWLLSEVRGILERKQAFEERQGLLNRIQAQSGGVLEALTAREWAEEALKGQPKVKTPEEEKPPAGWRIPLKEEIEVESEIRVLREQAEAGRAKWL